VECTSISVAIVDLAGSERLNKVHSNKTETASINSTLLVLGKCIHAFRDGTVIPFRESKLTKLLSEYFAPHYKIFMIAHINRTGEMFHENANVLEYANLSTNCKQLNPMINRSIMKSAARKREDRDADRSKGKSILKGKTETESALGGGRTGKKVVHIEESPTYKLLKEDAERRKKEMMRNYVYKVMGRMESYD
jgi:hypothetical protein